MTDRKKKRRGRLSVEILLLILACAFICVVMCLVLIFCATAVAENFMEYGGIVLSEEELLLFDIRIIAVCIVISVAAFAVLFMILAGERLAYIGKIARGIDKLKGDDPDFVIPVEGNNELTALAEEINALSEKRREIEAKRQALREEKEQFIRTMSHDIRTPLTSVIAYSELLSNDAPVCEEDRRRYLGEIRSKAYRIKELTDILLDGGARNVQLFENGRLLFEQLIEELEDSIPDFSLRVDISELPRFSGSFDLSELRRIFDNLATNIEKYARKDRPVVLKVSCDGGVTILQKNEIKEKAESGESYKMGITSIRRIAANYSGTVETSEEGGIFSIVIKLSEI